MAATSSVFRPGLLNGKVAIVTGGGTGIGKAITEELLYLGCKVMIASRNVERLKKAVDELKPKIQPQSEADISHMQCNIRKEEQVKKLMSETIAQFGKLDILVNNGGGQYFSATADIRTKGWNAVVDTNLTGTFLCCREAYNQWMGEHGGAIVNIILDMWRGCSGMSHSGAARAGVENLAKSMAIEWASSGVRVNCVAPGSIYNESAAAHYEGLSMFEQAIPLIPAKRSGTVEEVSAAVCFLLSPAAAFITGDTLRVTGGESLYQPRWPIPDHKNMPAYKWDTDSQQGTKSKL